MAPGSAGEDSAATVSEQLAQPKKPPASVYGLYLNQNRAELMKECAATTLAGGNSLMAATKLAGERYKALPAEERSKYFEMHWAAMRKYEEELAAFKAAGGVVVKKPRKSKAKLTKKTKGKRKLQKDPNRPKQPAGGAYGCYVAKNRAQLTKECEGKPVAVVSKLASERWHSLSLEEKLPYEQEFQAKRARYHEEMSSYVPPAGAEEDLDDVEILGESSDELENASCSTGQSVWMAMDVSPQCVEDSSDEAEARGNETGDGVAQQKPESGAVSELTEEKVVPTVGQSSAASSLEVVEDTEVPASLSMENLFAAAPGEAPTPDCSKTAACSKASAVEVSPDDEKPSTGRLVVVQGLVSMAQLNGKCGTLLRYLDDRSRWVCRLIDGGEVINLKESQFTLAVNCEKFSF